MKAKRFFSILLCILMLEVVFPASAFAFNEPTYEDPLICTVIWRDGNGTILTSMDYPLDDIIEYMNGNAEGPTTDKIPTKAADDNYTYVFSGWGDGEWYEDSTTTTLTFTPSFQSVPINRHKLMISYVYENGRTASNSFAKELKEGDSYSVVSPTIKNYTPDLTNVSGIMGTSDVNKKVTYKATNAVVPDKAKVAKIEFSKSGYSTVYNKSTQIEVVIKDQNGHVMKDKVVACEINGQTKKIKTGADGSVKFGTDGNLIPKTYVVQINCDNLSANVNLTVKKATPKLTAKKKTYKKDTKTKKYSVTLKDNTGKAIKNVKLTLKVNKKTYKAKTNAKGKTVFNIKKLTKKRTYQAVIKFAGNKYYNKVTKKAKILVK